MARCDNPECSREADHRLVYGFEHGPRIKNDLCGPCKTILLEGSHAVDIEVES